MSDIPDLLSLSPAMAYRAWQKHLADRAEPPEGELAKLAVWVGLAIKAWGGSVGKVNEDEEGARRNVAERLAAYVAANKG